MKAEVGLDVVFYATATDAHAATIIKVNDTTIATPSVGLAIFPPSGNSSNFQARMDVPYGPGVAGRWGFASFPTWKTYTPVMLSGGNPVASTTYANRVGKYRDDENIRHFTLSFDTTGTTLSTSTNPVQISLPGPAANRSSDRTVCDLRVISPAGTAIVANFGLILPGTSVIQAQSATASGNLLYSVFSATALAGTTKWYAAGFYEI